MILINTARNIRDLSYEMFMGFSVKMDGKYMRIEEIKTPCYVIDEAKLEENLKILQSVEKRTGAKILLAQKCFSGFYEYPLIAKYISGTTASGLYESRLGFEEMGKENHVFAPAYTEEDMSELVNICDHIVFNSKNQLIRHRKAVEEARKAGQNLSIGVRINPECSTQKDHAIYDPCAEGSRMGIRICDFDCEIVRHIDGIHFHTLCEQNSDDLEITLNAVEEKFGKYLHALKWINMGGGHHITRKDYDVEKLVKLINHIKDTYDVQVYLEPGEAVALDAGYNVTTVLDKVNNGIDILILDTSAACHMPDVIEMPYRPPLKDSGEAGEKAYTYRLAGNTCLAGDVIGDYSFDNEINIGDKLIFEDMAIYSMVKNNTFNGIPLPAIAIMDKTGECKVIKEFGYDEFKRRLS